VERWRRLATRLARSDAAFGYYLPHEALSAHVAYYSIRFVAQLSRTPDIGTFTPLQETAWGQRALRLFDPDGHVIEVAESMKAVVGRMLATRETVAGAAQKSMMPLSFVQECADSAAAKAR
jgi:hypothetical protein